MDGTPLAYPWEAGLGDAVVVSRIDATYCSPRCRQAASRARRGIRNGWGGAIDRRARRSRAAIAVAVTGQEEAPWPAARSAGGSSAGSISPSATAAGQPGREVPE